MQWTQTGLIVSPFPSQYVFKN